MQTGRVPILDWITAPELARLACVDRSTAQRWRRGDRPAPAAVLQLVELYHGGHVGPRAGSAWRGFWFDCEGLLRPPDFEAAIGAHELRAYLFLRCNGCSVREAHTLMIGAGAER